MVDFRCLRDYQAQLHPAAIMMDGVSVDYATEDKI
jgi:hypothetical protein